MAPDIPRCPYCKAEYFACKTDDRGICVKKPVGYYWPMPISILIVCVVTLVGIVVAVVSLTADWTSP